MRIRFRLTETGGLCDLPGRSSWEEVSDYAEPRLDLVLLVSTLVIVLQLAYFTLSFPLYSLYLFLLSYVVRAPERVEDIPLRSSRLPNRLRVA